MEIRQLLINFVTVNQKDLSQWHTRRKHLLIWTARYDLQ